ncbi:unnamed protein product, partial [Polarella glacialis]
AAISACGRGLQVGFALRLLDEMSLLRLGPNAVSLNAAASALERRGRWQEALEMLGRMRSAGAGSGGPDVVGFSSVLSACGRAAQWRHALALLEEMGEARVRPNVVSYTAAINACERGRAWVSALTLLGVMCAARLAPNAATLHAALGGSGLSHGGWRPALELLALMRQRRIRANAVACGSAVSACELAMQLAASKSPLASLLHFARSWATRGCDVQQSLQAEAASHAALACAAVSSRLRRAAGVDVLRPTELALRRRVAVPAMGSLKALASRSAQSQPGPGPFSVAQSQQVYHELLCTSSLRQAFSHREALDKTAWDELGVGVGPGQDSQEAAEAKAAAMAQLATDAACEETLVRAPSVRAIAVGVAFSLSGRKGPSSTRHSRRCWVATSKGQAQRSCFDTTPVLRSRT